MKWIKWTLIGMLLGILIVIVLVSLISFALWYYPKWFEHSSELDAGVVTGIVSIIVLVGTIGVTVAMNTQTQRMALKMNQENQLLQLRIQEMNTEAMRFQAKSSLRDEVLKQRTSAYRQLLKSLNNFQTALVSIYSNMKTGRSLEFLIKKDAECIKISSDVISEIDTVYVNSYYDYSEYISGRLNDLIWDAKLFMYISFYIVEEDEEGYIFLGRKIQSSPLDGDSTLITLTPEDTEINPSNGFFTNINILLIATSDVMNLIECEMEFDEIEQDIDSLNLKK
ncbi:putative membrane protein [Croceifilum oryzae]|uniref:Membrane protein n=1 Tax=Croceifilum oryzae TaxID=1553429 RepID=A0AAJ1THU4_9BACL|nr:hypothetical protein [Croceifilum oryzae]MDQ0416807.1 putative membrane protein [Croceifilum oryzae]